MFTYLDTFESWVYYHNEYEDTRDQLTEREIDRIFQDYIEEDFNMFDCAYQKWLSNKKLDSAHIVAMGTSKVWNGTSHGYDLFEFCHNISEIYHSRLFKDCNEYVFQQEDDTLTLTGYHHDGKVILKLYEVSDETRDKIEELGDDYELTEKDLKPIDLTFYYGV